MHRAVVWCAVLSLWAAGEAAAAVTQWVFGLDPHYTYDVRATARSLPRG